MRKIALVLIVLITFGLIGCGLNNTVKIPQDESTDNSTSDYENSEKTNEQVVIPDTDLEAVNKILDSMTLEEKVGQVFMAAFRYNSDNKPMQVLNEEAKRQIEQFHLGGIILFSQNIDTIPQTKKLVDDMQGIVSIPLFMAVDEEGGKVSRLNTSGKMHATRLPGNATLGRTNDTELAYEVGSLLGEELSSLGFNMDFAPVADVNTNPKNPVIGDRAFGSDPEKAGQMVEAMVKGLQDKNVSAVLKHFPGHGDTSTDTHSGAVIVQNDLERLEKIEFIPFEKGIAAGVDGVMAAHIEVPKITQEPIPASLSHIVLTDILRNELKHEKLIITDALEMGAISKYWSPDEAAVKAFEAGADILLMPSSIEKAYNGILSAVRDGRITEERLNDSVRRILYVKKIRGVLDYRNNGLNAEDTLGSKAHLDIAAEIIKKASINNSK